MDIVHMMVKLQWISSITAAEDARITSRFLDPCTAICDDFLVSERH